MADPLSIASGVAGLLSLATKIIASGMEYTSSAKNCSAEVQQVIREVSSLAVVLGQLSVLATRCSIPPGTGVNPICDKDLLCLRQVITDSAMQDSESLLRDVEKILGKYQKGSGKFSGLGLQTSLNSLTWQSKGKDVGNLLQRLREVRNNFTAAVIVDSK